MKPASGTVRNSQQRRSESDMGWGAFLVPAMRPIGPPIAAAIGAPHTATHSTNTHRKNSPDGNISPRMLVSPCSVGGHQNDFAHFAEWLICCSDGASASRIPKQPAISFAEGIFH